MRRSPQGPRATDARSGSHDRAAGGASARPTPTAEPTAAPRATGPRPARAGSASRASAEPAGLRLVQADGVRDTVIATVEAHGAFTTMARALRAAGMGELLGEAGPFTLFAPTDRAFARLPEGVLDALLQDAPRLQRVLAGHVVAGRARAPQPGTPSCATAVDGNELNITVHDGTFRVNGAKVVQPHVRASNGMIRGIDTVLLRH